jgi:hypothetical protein
MNFINKFLTNTYHKCPLEIEDLNSNAINSKQNKNLLDIYFVEKMINKRKIKISSRKESGK